MRTDRTDTSTVTDLLDRARGIPAVDVPQEVRDAAMRLKSDVKRALKGSLSNEASDVLHDLLIALDTLHRGRVPLIG